MKKLILSFLVSCTVCGFVLAQEGKVMLSETCLYLGNKSYLGPGAYTTAQLGIRDNRLASFNIPKGMGLQVFDLDNYRGGTETFYSSVICLNATWKSKVSSLKVFYIDDPNGGGNTVLPIEENSGNNLPPQGDKVIFYRDIKYSGMSRRVNTGSFSASDLGFLSGQVSSIYIPVGLSLNAVNSRGQTYTFTGSQSALNKMGWDNQIVRGTIQSTGSGGDNTLPPAGNKVIFYADANYSGMSRDLKNGSFSPSDLGFLKENISSVYVPSGLSLRVYNNSGGYRTFTASVANLASYGWDNKITTGIISGSPGGGTLPPEGNRVIFYMDMKYSGAAKQFSEGTHNQRSLGNLAYNISSIYIPYGWNVRVVGKNGSTQTFNSSISNLAQYGWDNSIIAAIVSSGGQQGGNNPGDGNRVNLYTEAGYRGSVTPCGEGAIPNIGQGADNNISSIKVPAGFAVTVYDGSNLSGANITFRNSVSDLSSYGWNKKISSVYVFKL